MKRKPPVIKKPETPVKQSERVERERQVPLFSTEMDSALPASSSNDKAGNAESISVENSGTGLVITG